MSLFGAGGGLRKFCPSKKTLALIGIFVLPVLLILYVVSLPFAFVFLFPLMMAADAETFGFAGWLIVALDVIYMIGTPFLLLYLGLKIRRILNA